MIYSRFGSTVRIVARHRCGDVLVRRADGSQRWWAPGDLRADAGLPEIDLAIAGAPLLETEAENWTPAMIDAAANRRGSR